MLPLHSLTCLLGREEREEMEREEMEREREVPLYMVYSTTAKVGPGCRWKPGTQSRKPTWLVSRDSTT